MTGVPAGLATPVELIICEVTIGDGVVTTVTFGITTEGAVPTDPRGRGEETGTPGRAGIGTGEIPSFVWKFCCMKKKKQKKNGGRGRCWREERKEIRREK